MVQPLEVLNGEYNPKGIYVSCKNKGVNRVVAVIGKNKIRDYAPMSTCRGCKNYKLLNKKGLACSLDKFPKKIYLASELKFPDTSFKATPEAVTKFKQKQIDDSTLIGKMKEDNAISILGEEGVEETLDLYRRISDAKFRQF